MQRREIVAVTLIPFILCLVLYVLTLAPGVTFEDSGELISAAYTVGVPHPPGYPIFCLVGKLFTLLPWGSVAWRVNLMSAVFTALSAAALSASALLLITRITGTSRGQGNRGGRPLLIYAAAIASGIMAGTAFEIWQQAVIGEVYALNTFIVTLNLLLLLAWEGALPAQRPRLFKVLCFTLGLGFLAHPISIVMVPLAVTVIALSGGRRALNGGQALAGIFYFILGLTPVVYLPLASRADPAVDWGDPETFRNFIQVVTRGLSYRDTYTLPKTIGQIAYYFPLAAEQWFPALLVPAAIGFALLFKRARKHFWAMIVFLVLTAPVVTVLTNYNVTTGAPEAIQANKWNVSVFYCLSYVCLSLAAAGGFWAIGGWLARLVRSSVAAAAVVVLLPVAFIPLTYGKADMSYYVFAEDYARDVARVTGAEALIITEHDPEFFPLVYYQAVEGKLAGRAVINRFLMQRSWYVQVLRDRYPAMMAASAREAGEYLRALEPFERGGQYDGAYIQSRYDALLNSLIARTVAAGGSVYLAFPPAGPFAQTYDRESLGVVLKLRHGLEPLTELAIGDLAFRDYATYASRLDFAARYMRDHYLAFLTMRGRQLDAAGRKAEADGFFEAAAQLRE